MKSHRNKGFSMIELMIVVVIVGILAAIAVPSYRNYVIKGSRAAVQTELIKLASLQEKIYLNSSAYACNAIATAYNGSSTGGLGIDTSDDGKYTFTLSACATNTYTITAVPVVAKTQVGNGCLSIQENGLRQWYQGHDNCTGTGTAW